MRTKINSVKSQLNIEAKNIGKKFGRNWIFRELNFETRTGDRVAITGNNGSGKSTLLQIISGFLTPSKGEIFHNGSRDIDTTSISFIGPYMDIIEEFSLREHLTFHNQFKKPLIAIEEMAERASIPLDKQIAEFSTGMKQRAKLITSFFYENEIIFMDEPTSNLDTEGFDWWKSELEQMEGVTIFIGSNQSNEIAMCSTSINL